MGPTRTTTLPLKVNEQDEQLPPIKYDEFQPEPEIAMLRLAIDKGAPIETIERLVALTEKVAARKAEKEFNEALNRIQSEIKRIAPDKQNPDKKNWWASYEALDRVVRPIYSREGMSLSFTHGDSPKENHVRTICRVSRGSHKEFYQMDIPVDTKGPKGGDVMTQTHATAAADSYCKRYLVMDIFNIAVGRDDVDGNTSNKPRVPDAEVEKNCAELAHAKDAGELKFLYTVAYEKAQEIGDKNAMARYIVANATRKKEFGLAGAR